jgi:hypothetical protein
MQQKNILMSATNTGSVSFASNEFTIDKPAFINQITASQVAVTGAGQVIASSTFGALSTAKVDLTGSLSGILSVQPAANTTSHTLTLPAVQGSADTYLKNNGTGGLSWEAVVGTGNGGDVLGPLSSTDNAIARFDQTSGKILQNSNVTISDSAVVAGVASIAMNGSATGTVTLQPAANSSSHTLTLPTAQGAADTYLSNDGSGMLSWLPIASGSNGSIIGMQRITASGTYTPTPGTKRAIVFATGGGGAGAAAVSGVNNSVGSGGNSGGTYVGLFVINDSETGTVTIGAGGTGSSTGNGATGGNTTFLYPATGTPNGTITGPGGSGGMYKLTGTTDDYAIHPSASRNTPFATAFNQVLTGGFPIWGQYAQPGVMINPDVGCSGSGAPSFWGNGAIGQYRNQVSSQSNGVSATANSGAGGSGAIQTNDNTNASGGSGGSGVVVVFEFQ